MNERRKFLSKLPATTLGIAAVATATSASAAEKQFEPRAEINTGLRDAFPDVPVLSHNGEKFNFYQDLIKDKIVLVSFMSIRGEEDYPVTANLSKIADHLGDRLGREVFINSVTRDPEFDTPERLKIFAEKYNVREGWRFLTGTSHVTESLATRLYRHHQHPGFKRSVDIVFYGNGNIGLWGAFPALIDPADAAGRIAWVMPGKPASGVAVKAGPRHFIATDRSSHNRKA